MSMIRAAMTLTLAAHYYVAMLAFLACLVFTVLKEAQAVSSSITIPMQIQWVLVQSNTSTAPSPSPRCDAPFVPVPSLDAIYLLGGFSMPGGGSSGANDVDHGTSGSDSGGCGSGGGKGTETADANASYGLNDVWRFSPSSIRFPQAFGQWSLLSSAAPWLPRQGAASAAVFVASSWHVLLYGGVTSDQRGQYLDDLWSFDTATGNVTPQRPLTTIAPAATLPAPSARFFTSMQPITLPTRTLLAIGQTPLGTDSLRSFLANPAVNRTGTVSLLVLFGGRSNPLNNYSTETSVSRTVPTYVTTDSQFHHDFGDLWFYSVSVNQWFRMGNLTCLNQSYQCKDVTSVDDLLTKTLQRKLSVAIQRAIATSEVIGRPSNVTDMVANVSVVLDEIQLTIASGFDQLVLHPELMVDENNGCHYSCSSLSELAPVLIPLSLECQTGGASSSESVLNCPFYNPLSGGTAVVFTQARPPAMEGQATAVHSVITNGITRSIYFQFGGFKCGGSVSSAQEGIFTTNYLSDCFDGTLYALDGFGNTLIWWSITPQSGSSSSYYWPAPRAFASMAIDSTAARPLLYVYGGAADPDHIPWTYWSDLFVFDLLGVTWLQVLVTGEQPPGTRSPGMALLPSLYRPPAEDRTVPALDLYLFGGCGPQSVGTNQMWVLRSSLTTQIQFVSSGLGLTNATAGVPASFVLAAVEDSAVYNSNVLTYAVGLASLIVPSWVVYDHEGQIVAFAAPTFKVIDLGGGLYSINYTITHGSRASCTVTYMNPIQSNTATRKVGNSPFEIAIEPGPPSPNHTMAVNDGDFAKVVKGATATLVLQLQDVFDNPELESAVTQPQFALFYETSDMQTGAGPALPFDFDTFDNYNGSYRLSYRVPDIDNYTLRVLMAGQEIADSPFTIEAFDPLQIPNSIINIFLALSILLGVLIFGAMVGVIVKRDDRVVRAGSPLFMVLICFGALLCVISVPVYGYSSPINCRLFPFLLTSGYIICLGAMFIKSYRVLLIFTSATLAREANLSDSHMLSLVGVLLAFESVINIVWLIFAPLTLRTYYQTTIPYQPYEQCTGNYSTAFAATSVAFNCLIALWGVYIAVRIRHVPEAFNESRLMGGALYNLALCLVLCIPLTWTATNTQVSHVQFIIPATIILWCCTVTVALTVCPKLWFVLHPPPPEFFEAYPDSGVMIKGVKGRAQVDDGDEDQQQTLNEHPPARRHVMEARRGRPRPAAVARSDAAPNFPAVAAASTTVAPAVPTPTLTPSSTPSVQPGALRAESPAESPRADPLAVSRLPTVTAMENRADSADRHERLFL